MKGVERLNDITLQQIWRWLKPRLGDLAGNHTHDAGDITSGILDAARIPNLDASKITSGTLSTDRYSAYADLGSENKLGFDAESNLIRSQDIKFGGNAYRNTRQTIPSGTWTRVILNATRFDIYPSGYSAHFDSTNGYFVIRKSGYYIINAAQAFAANSSGVRSVGISRNGSFNNVISHVIVPNSGSLAQIIEVTTIWYLTDGDTLELWVYQNSGGNLDIMYTVPSWSKLAFWLLFG